MYISQPVTLTEQYVDNDSRRNKYSVLVNANFKDFLDASAQGSQLEVKSGKLKQQMATLLSGIGMAAGSLGGPLGIPLGFTIGNTIGKYFGNVLSQRLYGQAINDMSEISLDSKIRHTQLVASLAFTNQIDGAVDTLRQNENKREKDTLQAMQV